MTKDRKHKHEEEIPDGQAEGVDTPELTEQAPAEIEALQKQLEEAQARAAEYKDSWLRAQAEFQNYRKRVERDNEMMYSSMKGDIVRKVLPVLDDLERALQNRPSDSGAWVSGIELIQKKLLGLLEAEGVRKIEAQGAAFDPNYHEAISHETVDGFESGQVIAVVQNGYTLGERVIRPALVRVAQ